MILSLIVFVSPTMLSFGNIAHLSNSLTFVPLYLSSLSQIFFLNEAHIPSIATSDPIIATPNSPVGFSIQPSDILDPFSSSPFNEQVEDEQVEDELPNPKLGSPTPVLPEDLAQDIPPRHSTWVKSTLTHLLDYHCYIALATLHKPHTYHEASTDPLCQIAMKEKLDALSKNHTLDLVTLPSRKSMVGCKWIYKIKTHSDGSIERYKTHLVAKCFTQEYGIDYEETFAQVTCISSVRILLTIVAASKWNLFQMDVKNAFLNGDLSKEFYMQPPPSLSIESNKVYHLQRAFHGLKQAPQDWFVKFSSTISRLAYMANHYDSTLFLHSTDKDTILLLLYVDDMIITGDDLSGIQELKDFLGQQFEMKDLGHLSYFLGLEITHSTDGLYINQAMYASELLSQAGFTDSKTIDTPVKFNVYLTPSGGKP